jgi:hypothetical protein
MQSCFLNDTTQQIDNELSYSYKENETVQVPYLTENSFKTTKIISEFWRYNSTSDRFVFNTIAPVFYELASDTRFYATFQSYGFFERSTLEKAFAIINSSTNIKTNAHALDTVYRVGFELAHNILKTFWRPKPFIMNRVESFLEAHFKGNFVIGMQLRFQYLKTWNDLILFFECAKSIEANLKHSKTVKWFISADNEIPVEMIRKIYPGKVPHSFGEIAHVSENLNGYERALVDIELLARSDETIITGGSTFGYINVSLI